MEVTRQSFESVLPEILDSIYSADFVAIDGEYTGIETAGARRSFFDAPADRYAKCRTALRQSAVLEFGLAAFRRLPIGDGFDNEWEARVYNFPLYPAPYQPLGLEFTCTAASLEFLRRHSLDLNRVVDCGAYYLNEDQEAQLRRLLKSDGAGGETLGAADEDALGVEAERIATCLSAVPAGAARVPVRRIGCLSSHGVRTALATRLQSATTVADGYQLVLLSEPPCLDDPDPEILQPDGCVLWTVRQLKTAASEAAKAAADETEAFALRCVGFSRIFRALANLRKPIVGHNCFIDLLAMYQYFYRSLPADYEAWKAQSFRQLTPLVWDTKHLLYELRSCSASGLSSLPVGALTEAHAALSAEDASGNGTAGSAPKIRHQCSGPIAVGWAAAHRAGWDAFMAGEVFLRVAHRMLLLSLRPGSTVDADKNAGVDFVRRPSFAAYRRVLESRANRVNLIKARQHCVRLDAPDPESRRPPVLVLRRCDGGLIDLLWVRDLVARYGLADLRSRSSGQEILVAMSTFPGARDVAKELAGDAEFLLEPRSRLRHSRPLRLAVWAGTGLFTLLAVRSVFKIAKSVPATVA